MSFLGKKLHITILMLLARPALAMQELTTRQQSSAGNPIIAPTVFIHGLNCTPHDMQPLVDHVHELSPQTPVLNVCLPKKGWAGLKTLKNALKEQVQADPRFAAGCNVICHSIGGVVTRFAIEENDMPPVLTYCSLGTPQRGIEHLPADSDVLIDALLYRYWRIHPFETLESKLARLACLQLIQNESSVANILHKPSQEAYYKACMLLAKINNETDHPDAQRYKENFTKIGHVICLAGLLDTMVEPAVSTHWAYYRMDGSNKVLEPIEVAPMYSALGIDQLKNRGAFEVVGVYATHAGMRTDKEIFLKHIAPALTHESEKKAFLQSRQSPIDHPEQ
ncbi:hypothetical protein CVU75_01135 [Candidatus Dependentiae bacterium HGW-Dependentiae-1]|nr:MAG: hypothetical protein CVU75_01135 [Candidatus Dependentiae bacterium HGW-Dependentiae-1]